ncbi:hypothetical protein MEO41_27135, partial [Dolichospermum sp. ST_sed4]|nr:hypothetical protein [Dolichospermum sp. ST_sed4]
TDICEQCTFDMSAFTNHGKYVVKNEFDPNRLKGNVLLSGELKAGIINLLTEGNIVLEEHGKITSPRAIGLFGKQIELSGEIGSSLIQLDGKEQVINKGKINVDREFLLKGTVFDNWGKIEVGSKSHTTDIVEEKTNKALFNAVINNAFNLNPILASYLTTFYHL